MFRHILNRALAHVVRFSATPQHFPESVAEHSYYTAYMTMLMCDLVRERGREVDRERAVAMALVHDAEEMFSGDILGPFKHYSPSVTSAIREVNSEILPQVFSDLPEDINAHLTELWQEEGRQETIEAKIVKMADRLSLLAKCAEEVNAGNTFFQEMHDKELEKIRKVEDAWWLEIKDTVLSEGR